MLVLSRKKNESIVIDDRIKITIVEVRGDKVRLGIEAPREISVMRAELVRQGTDPATVVNEQEVALRATA